MRFLNPAIFGSMRLKTHAKRVANVLGANEWLMRGRTSELLVLCYHGVLSEPRQDRWSYQNSVDAESFSEQIRWLREHVELTDLDGVQKWHEGRWTGPKGPALVTFDDGYRNNLTQAAPILAEFGVPAIFFLSSGYVGTSRLLWLDEVRARILHWPEPMVQMPGGTEVQLPATPAKRRYLADEVVAAVKKLPEEACREYRRYLEDKTVGVDLMDDPEARSFMSWNEARQLRNMGFEIGAHTVDHPILSRIEQSRVGEELRGSKERLRQELGAPIRSLSYPNGSVNDVNEAVFSETQSAGFEWAFTTTPAWQKPGVNKHRVGRICVAGHTDLTTFKCYASGLHTRLTGGA